jgi:thiol-disulfide isomerase/thioredoxin
MLPLGTRLPEFVLKDTLRGATVNSRHWAGKPVLVMFICNHCPYVIHVRDELTRLADEYGRRGVAVVAINSNSVKTHPQDGPEAMKVLGDKLGWQFPYLFDETQAVAKAFQAACTPEFYLFGNDGALVYRGQLDGSRPGNAVPVTGSDLRGALEALLEGRPVSSDQKPSIGCNIKWHPSA